MRQLTAANGDITLAKSYTPYGEVLSSSGSSQSTYGFTGETSDASGLVYLRARYYSPNDGRFISRDTFPGNAAYPASFNHFSYVNNNPVNYTDPSGNCFDPITFIICSGFGGAVVSGGGNLAYQLMHNGGNWGCVDWGEVGAWATGGALITMTALPMMMVSPDSIIDLASIAFDVYTGNSTALALDSAALLIPGVTGLGAASHADEAYDAMRYADEVSLGMSRSQQNILMRNLDEDALIAMRSRPSGAYELDRYLPAKTGDVKNATKILNSEGIDVGIRMKNGKYMVSDLDVAGYTINGIPVNNERFLETFADKFNNEYGYNIITHGHLVSGFDNPDVVANLVKEGGDNRIAGLLNEDIHLFDASGYKGSMKYYKYYRDFVIKLR